MVSVVRSIIRAVMALRMLFLLACALAIFAPMASAREAGRIQTLTPRDDCPTSGPYLACLTIPLQWIERASKGATYRKRRGDNEPVLLRGRLAGGAPQVFRLTSFAGNAAGTDLGTVAYLGRTAANQPIILTNRGPLEIEAPFIDARELPGLVVIDETRWRIVARYLDIAKGEYVVNSAQDIAVLDFERGVCIVAPRRRPGPLVVAKGKCKAREPLGDGLTLDRRVSGNVSSSFPDQIERFPHELGLVFADPVSFGDPVRVNGARILLTQPQYEETCGTDIEPDHPYEPLTEPVDWMGFRE